MEKLEVGSPRMTKLQREIDQAPLRRHGQAFTQERGDKIIEALRAGMSLQRAARYAGVTVVTVRRWLKAAREGKAPELEEFHDAVVSASASLERLLLGIIVDAAQDGSWQAASWLLERLWPQRYVKVIRRELTGYDRRPLRVVLDVGRIDGPAAMLDEGGSTLQLPAGDDDDASPFALSQDYVNLDDLTGDDEGGEEGEDDSDGCDNSS